MGAHVDPMHMVDLQGRIPGGDCVSCYSTAHRYRTRAALERMLQLVRQCLERALGVVELKEAKSIRIQELLDTKSLPLDNVNEFVKVDRIWACAWSRKYMLRNVMPAMGIAAIASNSCKP